MRDAAVIGMPDRRLGEVPVAVVVPTMAIAKLPTDAAANLIDSCKERLAKFKAPRRVVFVDGIPRNDAGKVARDALAELVTVSE